ncbi:flagellar biosynthesis protein FlhA [Aquisalinus flavus]|uniref:Flagellar biosynthesis protein FlhA n=1 Tax=Aquisalinus flavus TaxID=1526572 RepID=A0A8J2Y5E1_9PROT|nr:flagellar biosynthesis protein FlhA [Aquisalinus flavus]MBD0425924.1 flagellar biosynthesis protein FlhA [Aquisalinus flavus]UNE48482.1 flagellar biosynthesis protein FlhA [Aquisalinus flavus]GGD12177.1 flagellar biosynthesis protein FlhA [Aquisalinus flavus]
MPELSIRSLYQPTVLLALALMVVIVMMVLPIPAWMLDVGLTASFAFAILIFTITLFIEKPLDFSSFPSILLASLLLRLSLNISSTKLIIGEGHTGTDAAGGVIEGFAMFIMGGNMFLGLIVFCVLIIVNFMVITKGAGRMAEVGARFALDAMPGRQLAIDSDVAAGAISHEEAKRRREVEQEEASFLGSLDGVSKFVKGDAIAGLLITLLNLIAGMAIGLGVHQLSFGEAVQNYSILTVGDGLVSQIPAVIISISAALLLSKGRGEGSVDLALFDQLGKHPAALYTVAGILLVFGLMPGLPFLPFTVAAGILAFFAWQEQQKRKKAAETEVKRQKAEDAIEPEKLLGDVLDLDDIHIELAKDLVPVTMDPEFGFDQRIEKIRKYIAEEYGFIVPSIRLTDSASLESGKYRIKIQGTEVAANKIVPNHLLALMEDNAHPEIRGDKVKEPVYGASARWVATGQREELLMNGVPVVEAPEVLATHILETIQANFGKLMTRRALREILDAFTHLTSPERSKGNQRILDEFVPDKVPEDTLQSVLRLLLEERVSIRNLAVILETISEVKGSLNSAEQIAEFVRQRLSFQFIFKLRDDAGKLPLVQLGPKWEELFTEHELTGKNGQTDIALPPGEFNRLAGAIQEKLNHSASRGTYAAIATSTRRRRFLKTVLAAKGIRNPVIAYEEIPPSEQPAIVGIA